MEELREILNEIESVYNMNISNDKKYNIVSSLWSKYYKLKQELGIQLDDDLNMCLLFENECYKINQEPKMDIPNNELVIQSLDSLEKAIECGTGITTFDIHNILSYIVYYTRRNLSFLGIDIQQHSLNGYCELAQALSIKPLEELGLFVTKNLAQDNFNYSENHAFGTVTFPIYEDSKVILKPYLIDVSYRQFFTSTSCHEGLYCDDRKPAPGFFVENENFAKELMREGFIELTPEIAELYGVPFTLSGYGDFTSIDYYNNILNDKNDYVLSESQLDDLKVVFPDYNSKYKI